jgi:hypothetical protein
MKKPHESAAFSYLYIGFLYFLYTVRMDWGNRRKIFVETVLALCGVVLVIVVLVAVFYKAPSCTDNKQDGNETGIDCGVGCPYLCSSDEIAPLVVFAIPVSPQYGRTDLIAYVANKNVSAQVQGAQYSVVLYDRFNKRVAAKTGTVNLLPASTAPIFIPDLYQGNDPIATAFVTFATSTLLWQHDSARPIIPQQTQLQIFDGATPKITATLTNPTAYPIYNETVVATVFNAKNNAIAASQTVIPTLPAQGSAPIVFTWNKEFSSKPVRVEILPVY